MTNPGDYFQKVRQGSQEGDITVKLIGAFKSLISQGRIAPGDKLPPERELARRFQVNRSSLRQALKVMQLMGLVSQRVGDGTYFNRDVEAIFREPIELLILLADISEEELFEARLIVEPELARRAAERATTEDLAALRRAIKAMESSTTDQARIDADLAFHHAIFRASGNRVCRLIFAVIHQAVLRSMTRIVTRSDVERPLAFHKAIYSAVSRRLQEEAQRQMMLHLVDVRSQFTPSQPNETSTHRASE
jgi:GntR family transcriptional regulator, transcriptional repressor for pyruvate dehydrogenase complex